MLCSGLAESCMNLNTCKNWFIVSGSKGGLDHKQRPAKWQAGNAHFYGKSLSVFV